MDSPYLLPRRTVLSALTDAGSFWQFQLPLVAWDRLLAHSFLFRIVWKDLQYFSCCVNIYWDKARFRSFSALGEYAEWNFYVRQTKNLNCILFSCGPFITCNLIWLKYWPYKVLINCWKILEHFPNTLKVAKVCPRYDGMDKKTISRYCPFKAQTRYKKGQCLEQNRPGERPKM